MRNLLADLTRLMVMMLVGIEAIYLSDKLITHLLFDMLKNQLGVGFLIEMMVLAVPEILFVGFPLAVVIAVYLLLLRRRESGDFVVLASFGLGPATLVAFCLGLGVPTVIFSAVLGGFVEPLAAHRLGQRLLSERYEAARSGTVQPGRFLVMDDTAFFTHPEGIMPADGALVFAHRDLGASREQVITARTGRIVVDEEAKSADMILDEPQIHSFARTAGQNRNLTMRAVVDTLSHGAVSLTLPEYPERRASVQTMTLTELLRADMTRRPSALEEALSRLIGIALAFASPLLACMAVALTRGRMVLLALPAVLGVVLSVGFLSTPIAGSMVGLGMFPALGVLAGTVLGMTTVLCAVALSLGQRSILPERGRL